MEGELESTMVKKLIPIVVSEYAGRLSWDDLNDSVLVAELQDGKVVEVERGASEYKMMEKYGEVEGQFYLFSLSAKDADGKIHRLVTPIGGIDDERV